MRIKSRREIEEIRTLAVAIGDDNI